MCIFDMVKVKKTWKPDPRFTENENLLFGAIHFTEVFFSKYRIMRQMNENDFDDMAADCSVAVYESAKRNIGKWDREKYRLDQYLYGRAWSIVGGWLKVYFDRKRRSPLGEARLSENNLTTVEYDVGTDEIASNILGRGLRYVVFSKSPKSYMEAKLSDAAEQFLDYYEDCIDLGIEPAEPEDFLTNKNSKETDLHYLKKILKKDSPSPRVAKKRVRASLGKV